VSRLLAIALTVGAVVWTALIVTAPFALPSRVAAAPATLVYAASSLICHQRPERSFAIGGVQMPVCARCSGLYISGALGSILGWSGRRRTRHAGPSIRMKPSTGRLKPASAGGALLVIAAVPTAVTFGLEFVGLMEFSNVARALAALPLGVVAGCLFVRMLRYDSRLDGFENTDR
jgi:uncharacterized membrane protein